MNDLISRQAAIDALQKCRKHCIDPFDSYHIDIQDAENQLWNLPTVQPEERTEKRTETHACDLISRGQALEKVRTMQTYKLFECDDTILVDKADVQTELMMLPTIQPEPQWIPIERELPRDGSWNIFTDGKNISVERYKADAIDHFFPNGRWFQLEDVIAWMPLPEPYQKGATT